MSDLVFTEACLADSDAIAKLSNETSPGFDYVTKTFPKWLSNDRWYPYVVKANNKVPTMMNYVIGLTVLNITNGGKSVVIRHSRVAKEYRRRGIYTTLINFALRSIHRLFPSLRTVIRGRSAEKELFPGYTLIKKPARIVIACKEIALKDFDVSANVDQALQEEMLTAKEFEHSYDVDSFFKSLFVRAVLMIGGEVYDLDNKENWAYFPKRSGLSFLLSQNSPTSVGNRDISFSVFDLDPFISNDGEPLIVMNFYGNDLNYQTIKYHVFRCMQAGFDRFRTNFKVSLHVNSVKNQEFVAKSFKEGLEDFEILLDVRYQISECDIQQHIKAISS